MSKRLLACLLLGVAVGAVVGRAQGQSPTGLVVHFDDPELKEILTTPSVQRLDPALDAIVSSSAKLEVLKHDYFGGVQGPTWVKESPTSGYLLFSDLGYDRLYKLTPDGTLSVFKEHVTFTGDPNKITVKPYDNGRELLAILGAPGVLLDREGRILLCVHGDRALVRLEKNGTRTVLADHYNGKWLNGPNDVAVRSDGSLYITDIGYPLSHVHELPTNVYRWKDGNLQLVDWRRSAPKETQAGTANGIAFSPDEKYLYFTVNGRVLRFDVQPDGMISNGQVLVDMTKEKEPGFPDGMKVDRKGNLYTGGPGGLWIISPEGKHLGTIVLHLDHLRSVGFGDVDGKGLYIAASRGLYRIRLNAPGI